MGALLAVVVLAGVVLTFFVEYEEFEEEADAATAEVEKTHAWAKKAAPEIPAQQAAQAAAPAAVPTPRLALGCGNESVGPGPRLRAVHRVRAKLERQSEAGVRERILLHLRDYVDYKSSVEVLFALSQMGIANAVAIARSNVPRAIASLKDSGLLVERQAHVSGVARNARRIS